MRERREGERGWDTTALSKEGKGKIFDARLMQGVMRG